MSKGLIICIVLFVGAFVGLNWVLTRPTPTTLTATEVAQNTPQSEVIRQTAAFVQQNPNEFKPQLAGVKLNNAPVVEVLPQNAADASAQSNQNANANRPNYPVPVVLGVKLDANSQQDLWTDKGREKFLSSIAQNLQLAVQDVNQAWSTVDAKDLQTREALLEMTHVIARGANSAEANAMLFSEAAKYMAPENTGNHEAINHGGRALQYYIQSEPDQQKLAENLAKIGVPMLDLQQDRLPASDEPETQIIDQVDPNQQELNQ